MDDRVRRILYSPSRTSSSLGTSPHRVKFSLTGRWTPSAPHRTAFEALTGVRSHEGRGRISLTVGVECAGTWGLGQEQLGR